MFAVEWPPRSGKTVEFPEVDKAAWFSLDEGLKKVTRAKGRSLRPWPRSLARRTKRGRRIEHRDPERPLAKPSLVW